VKPIPVDDEALMDLIRVALSEEIDPEAMRLAVAAPVLVGARNALAHLEFDSIFDEDRVLLRDASTLDRSVTWVGEHLTVDVEVLEVSVRQFAGQKTVPTDNFGRFRCKLASGPIQLRIEQENDVFSTPWLTR
jgi:hypothetical protein